MFSDSKHSASLTAMQHHLLEQLEPLPFDDKLLACGFDSSLEVYSYDEFRRLYNDAVETMNQYRYLLSIAKSETQTAQREADRYHAALMDCTDL